MNTDVPSESRFPDWACQRSTPLKHHNHFLSVYVEKGEVMWGYGRKETKNQLYCCCCIKKLIMYLRKCFSFQVTKFLENSIEINYTIL